MMKHIWIGLAFLLAFSILGLYAFEARKSREFSTWAITQDIGFRKWLIMRQSGEGPRPSHVNPASFACRTGP